MIGEELSKWLSVKIATAVATIGKELSQVVIGENQSGKRLENNRQRQVATGENHCRKNSY